MTIEDLGRSILFLVGYDLHIEGRDGAPISVEEWKQAVQKLPAVRLREDPTYSTSTPDGVVKIKGNDGDAEIYFQEDGEWVPAFFFRRGRVTFSGRLWDISHIRDIALQVAAALHAQIVGDEGETYYPEVI